MVVSSPTQSGEPADQPAGRFATFQDPDGNRMSLRQTDGR